MTNSNHTSKLPVNMTAYDIRDLQEVTKDIVRMNTYMKGLSRQAQNIDECRDCLSERIRRQMARDTSTSNRQKSMALVGMLSKHCLDLSYDIEDLVKRNDELLEYADNVAERLKHRLYVMSDLHSRCTGEMRDALSKAYNVDCEVLNQAEAVLLNYRRLLRINHEQVDNAKSQSTNLKLCASDRHGMLRKIVAYSEFKPADFWQRDNAHHCHAA